MVTMSIETSQRLLKGLPIEMRWLKNWLSRGRAARSTPPACRHFLTQEEFQTELVVLGLYDQTFGPNEYAGALGKHLGLTVSIDVVADAAHPILSRELARKGITGELLYRADLAMAHIVAPGSLTPLALTFTLLHELGHLAAGDMFVDPQESGQLPDDLPALPTLEVPDGSRLALGQPFARVEHREYEANLRAGYAFVAGCLGSDNPYTQRMYDIL